MHAVLAIVWFSFSLATPVNSQATAPVPGEPAILSTDNYDWKFNTSGYECSSSDGIISAALSTGSALSKQGCAEFCSVNAVDATAIIITYYTSVFGCRCKLDCPQLAIVPPGLFIPEVFLRTLKPSTESETAEAPKLKKPRGRSQNTPHGGHSNIGESSAGAGKSVSHEADDGIPQ